MVLMGLGMGLISTPATESILLVLPPARAGVGSAVNDATRELGGTLGVAVVGSLFSSVYAARLADGAFAAVRRGPLAQAQDSVAVAIGDGPPRPDLVGAAQDAFMAGLHAACLLVGRGLLRRRARGGGGAAGPEIQARGPARTSPGRSRSLPTA